MNNNINETEQSKKIKVCYYYSPPRLLCTNHNHLEYNENNAILSKHPKCEFKGKYWECSIVDKLIELTLNKDNFVISKEEIIYKNEVK